MSDLVGNPKDRLPHNASQIKQLYILNTEPVHMVIISRQQTLKKLIRLPNAQADLHCCCSHMQKQVIS